MRYSLAVLLLICGCGLSLGPDGLVIKHGPMIVSPNDEYHFKQNNLECMIIQDKNNDKDLTSNQQGMLTGHAVRNFMLKNCKIGDDGKTACFRVVDDSTTLAGDWVNLKARGIPKSLPWIILRNGNEFYSGPLPKTYVELQPILDKFAGVD